MNPEGTVSIEDAAQIMGCSVRTVWRRIADGKLEVQKGVRNTWVTLVSVVRASPTKRYGGASVGYGLTFK